MNDPKLRRPGDLILDRYMPDATQEEREEGRANLFFQTTDGNAHRRLSAENPHGGFGKAALLHHHYEKLKLGQFHSR